MLGRSYTLRLLAGPSRVFSRGLGRGCWGDNTPLLHTRLLPGLARTCSLKPERGGARLWPCQTWQEKKKKRLPFRPLPDKQNMPITCPAFGHIKQNSALEKVLGYVASQGADRRGGGLTYFSPLARSVTCWESPRTTHSRPPGRR